ncbi:hypothetical protein KCP77_14710 [Salmonella enterica subsp. enterica]|nr:hypothetical protein KCP77_14710 [Salmonella enterica subsp. enterica]
MKSTGALLVGPASWSNCFYYVKLMMSLSSRMKYGGRSCCLRRNLYLGTLHLRALAKKRVISLAAASKTFGLSSLRISNFLIPDLRFSGVFLSRLDGAILNGRINSIPFRRRRYRMGRSGAVTSLCTGFLRRKPARWFDEQATGHLPGQGCPGAGTWWLWMDYVKSWDWMTNG